MYLKDLSINGFKSFAKKAELEFSTPITAIVGPNGSGKSNVAEAFRFVLGEQSIKSMRGRRGEDLIFNGSETVSRCNRASVSVTLENKERNGKKVFPLDFDLITVERAVNRDGTNEYSINGSGARLRDVQELLASANIGPTGHHIISQGEADRILSASPRERREMIEDALGLKVYQFKKTESERKLTKTRENILQVESLRREVAPHLKFLEKQVKKIERSLELQKELSAFYAEYLRREDVYLAYHADRLTALRMTPVARREELLSLLAHAKKKLESKAHDEKRTELVALEENISSVRTNRQETVRALGQLEGQILFLERRIADAEKQATHETEQPIPYHTLKHTTDSVESLIVRAEKENDVSTLKKALREILEKLTALIENASKLVGTKDTAAEEEELGELRKEKASHDEVLATLEGKEHELERQYDALKRSIEAEHSENREAEREVFAIMNEQREVEGNINNLDREISVLAREREEFKRELQEAVSLLGRAASAYFEYDIKDDSGVSVTHEAIVSEERSRQYERRRTLEKMKIRLEELGQGSSEDVLKEYKDVKERDEFLVHEIEDLTASVSNLESLIADLTRELNELFVAGIDKIGVEFNKFFGLMFGGGSATLLRVKPKIVKKDQNEDLLPEELESLEEPEEEAEEGIEIDVKLPNKRVRGLDMLSGGERALTSIALIFAMSQVNPPLFVILDETDAALDEANSRRYGDMITALSEKSQLILITHNRETMSRAGVLYGVTMAGDGVSKLLSVKFDEAVAVAK